MILGSETILKEKGWNPRFSTKKVQRNDKKNPSKKLYEMSKAANDNCVLRFYDKFNNYVETFYHKHNILSS